MAKLVNAESVAQGMARSITRDTFVNFAAKVGIGTGNLSDANTYGFNPITRNRTLTEWMYRGSWVCGVGVDCVADDMTREWVEIKSGAQPSDIEKIYAIMRAMQIPQGFNAMAKWARLYGGAVNIIMIEGQRLDQPFRIETVAPGQFKGLITMDRWMLTPDMNNFIKVPGPDYGNPAFYEVNAQSPNMPFPRQKVHHSRIIRMEGVELPFWQKQAENMWGISVLERLYDRLTAFDSVTQGASQLAFRAYLRTLKIKNLREIIAAGGPGYDALVKNVQMIREFQSNEGITLLDGEDEMEMSQYGFAGLSDLLGSVGEQIAGALQVPLTRLLGQAPGGLNSDGESGMRTYEDNIKRLQERWFRRPLDVIIPLCAINADVELKPGWEYDFLSLRQLTDKEQADINTADVTAIVQAQGMGLLPSAVILKELRQSGRKTGRWTNITDHDIKDAEIADLVPSPSELGVQGPPGAPENDNEDKSGDEGENPDAVTRHASEKPDGKAEEPAEQEGEEKPAPFAKEKPDAA